MAVLLARTWKSEMNVSYLHEGCDSTRWNMQRKSVLSQSSSIICKENRIHLAKLETERAHFLYQIRSLYKTVIVNWQPTGCIQSAVYYFFKNSKCVTLLTSERVPAHLDSDCRLACQPLAMGQKVSMLQSEVQRTKTSCRQGIMLRNLGRLLLSVSNKKTKKTKKTIHFNSHYSA